MLFELAFSGRSIRLERIINNFQGNKHRIQICLNYLINKGYVDLKNTGDSRIFLINQKGRQRILKYNIKDLKIKKTKEWDNKWRLIIFDIPEKEKSKRNMLTRKLKNMGFICLQKSVFVHPYRCFKEVNFLRNVYGITKYVKIFTLENTDDAKSFLCKYYKINHEN